MKDVDENALVIKVAPFRSRDCGGCKGVDHRDAVITLARVQILAKDRGAAHLFRGGQNGGVPIRDAETLFRIDRLEHQVARDGPNGKVGQRSQHGDRVFVRHLQMSFADRDSIEFLQYLRGKANVGAP